MLPPHFLSLACLFGVSFSLPQRHYLEQTIINSPSLPQTSGLEMVLFDGARATSAIRDILLDNEIIGDVLDDFEPSYYIDLAYPKFHEPVMLGNDIPVKAVSKRPTFSFHAITPPVEDSNSTFTLILTDPDATSRDNPKLSEQCHWIMTNLTTPIPSWFVPQKLMEGELESYLPPAPPKKTGKHRYVFVLLEGETADLKAPKERPHWGYGKVRHGIRDWAEEHDLKVVGANFFFAQHKKQ